MIIVAFFNQNNLFAKIHTKNVQIYDGKCVHYIDWLVEQRPSFSPPRRDIHLADAVPGATEVWSGRLDTLNTKFERLLEALSQRLKTAVEVNGAEGLVSTVFCYFSYLCEMESETLFKHDYTRRSLPISCLINFVSYFISSIKVFLSIKITFGNNMLMNINWIWRLSSNLSFENPKELKLIVLESKSATTDRLKIQKSWNWLFENPKVLKCIVYVTRATYIYSTIKQEPKRQLKYDKDHLKCMQQSLIVTNLIKLTNSSFILYSRPKNLSKTSQKSFQDIYFCCFCITTRTVNVITFYDY